MNHRHRYSIEDTDQLSDESGDDIHIGREYRRPMIGSGRRVSPFHLH